MARAVIGWRNAVLTASLTASSAAGTMPVSNLQAATCTPATGWQTAASTTSAYLQLDTNSTASRWFVLALFRTNLTSSATVRWRIGPNADASSPVYDSGVLPAGIVAGFGQSIHIPPVVYTARYCRVDIADSGNPDGFLNIPGCFAGDAWQPASNVSPGTMQGRDDGTTEVVTRGGQEFPLTYWRRRRWELDFQGIRTAEVWPYYDDLDAQARLNTNVLFVPDPASVNISREAVFGRLRARADLSYWQNAQDRRAWRATITERL